MRVKITLEAGSRLQAIEMRALRGIETPVDFEGPEFENVESLHYEDGFFHVRLKDRVYSYKAANVARVAQYPTEEELSTFLSVGS